MHKKSRESRVEPIRLMLAGAVVFALLLSIAGCSNIFTDPLDVSPTAGARAIPSRMDLSGEGELDNPDLVALGKALFFDTNLSTPGGQSCASCHDPKAGFADPQADVPVSDGVLPMRFGRRNASSSAYAAFSPPLHYDPTPRPGIMEGMYVGGLFWDGRADSLEQQAEMPFLNPLEMHNPNEKTVVHGVRKAEYAPLFESLFGAGSLKDEESAYRHITEAIAAYERSSEMNPFSSKFDLSLDGMVQLTESEARGLALFTGKARCLNCHALNSVPGVKPLFTNFGYQNTGVPKNPENPYYDLPRSHNPQGKESVDLGLGAVLGDPRQNGGFKIPSLRNVAVTPPYMHNGVFKTIREVIAFNNTRDVPGAGWPPPEVSENVHRHMPPMPGTFGRLGLSDQEIDDIVDFFGSLTDGYAVEH